MSAQKYELKVPGVTVPAKDAPPERTRPEQKYAVPGRSRPSWITRATAYLTSLCFVFLGAVGLYATFTGKPLSGMPLLGHVGVGGVFAVSLALLTVFRSHTFSFDSPEVTGHTRGPGSMRKTFFWLFTALGLSLMLSSVLMMMPQFGTDAQVTLLSWHRWSAILAIPAWAIYGLSVMGDSLRS